MNILLGYDVSFSCASPTPSLFLLNVHSTRRRDLLGRDQIRFSREICADSLYDAFGNMLTRCVLPVGDTALTNRVTIADSGTPDLQNPMARQVPVQELPPDALQFLLGSRYCETQKLSSRAWDTFGG